MVSRVTLGVALALLGAAVLTGCGGGSSSTAPVASVSLPAGAQGLRPQGQTVEGVISRVVDGDTVHVNVDGDDVTVRMIGINTPETVKPDSPIECFGPEASEFAKQQLTGQPVLLEFDATQGMTDQYDRTLAYVWRTDAADGPVLFNLEAVAGGYAYERQYGPTPYAWKEQFAAAQSAARAADAGLWGACSAS